MTKLVTLLVAPIQGQLVGAGTAHADFHPPHHPLIFFLIHCGGRQDWGNLPINIYLVQLVMSI